MIRVRAPAGASADPEPSGPLPLTDMPPPTIHQPLRLLRGRTPEKGGSGGLLGGAHAAAPERALRSEARCRARRAGARTPRRCAALERIEREPWVASARARRRGRRAAPRRRLDRNPRAPRWRQGDGGEERLADLARGQRFSVQFWDANATKALHVGHLRNLAIGNALAAALAQAGARSSAAALISDAGPQHGRGDGGRDEQRPPRAGVAGPQREERPLRRLLLRRVRRRRGARSTATAASTPRTRSRAS